ncbi:unnamed protein product [Effrenium voratum]|nr:unnamed protein product [Effrenium voratum]
MAILLFSAWRKRAEHCAKGRVVLRVKEDDIEGLTKEELTQSIISFVACLAAIFDIAVAVYFMRRLVSPASPPLVDAASSDTVAPECKMAAVQPLFSAAVRTSHQVKRVNMMMNAAFALVQSMQPIRQSVYRACVAQSRNRFLRPLSWPR